jgi:hypothetical protein
MMDRESVGSRLTRRSSRRAPQAALAAEQQRRYADGPEISLSVKSVDGTRIRVGSGQG